jgi:hypothetical protein
MENQNPTAPVGAQVPAELNPQQAISVLIQAVNFAQSKGVYSLEDAEILSKAVKVFVKKEDKPAADAPVTEPTAETVTPAN